MADPILAFQTSKPIQFDATPDETMPPYVARIYFRGKRKPKRSQSKKKNKKIRKQ